jgi:hypothetical protein
VGADGISKLAAYLALWRLDREAAFGEEWPRW